MQSRNLGNLGYDLSRTLSGGEKMIKIGKNRLFRTPIMNFEGNCSTVDYVKIVLENTRFF